jgi:nitroreductase
MKTNYIKALKQRYACKKFDSSKKVDSETINRLLDGLNLTASSFGLQPFKFVVIENKEIQESLVAHSWNQRQVADCSHLFVLAIRTDLNEEMVEEYIQEISSTRGIPVENLGDYKNMMTGFLNSSTQEQRELWALKQTYICLGNLLSQCAIEEIDSCPMEGFIPAEYDKILGFEKLKLKSTLVIPVGYKSEDDAYASLPKVRRPLSSMVVEIK